MGDMVSSRQVLQKVRVTAHRAAAAAKGPSPDNMPDASPLQPPSSRPGSDSNKTETLNVLLPRLVAEYKSPEYSGGAALHQAEMYAVASAAFLDAIGIKDHPVFALAADGTKGGIVMCERSCNEMVRAL